ncbi:O-antigen ligase family protein, partial [Candidatus Poribacteria bacterium]|nr:O-antigen ligase family protein [Candidatus Poribacteria bacterium]
RRKWAVVGVALGMGAVVLLIPGIRAAVLARAMTMVDPEFASNKTRLLRWGFALLMFAQNPILGAGHGMFARSYVNESFLGDVGRFQMGAHNEYMQVLAELGALGILGWLWLIVAFYVYGLRLLRRLQQPYWYALAAGIMAVQTSANVHNLVGNFMAGGTWTVPFWLAYAALPAIGYLAERQDGDEPEPAAARS